MTGHATRKMSGVSGEKNARRLKVARARWGERALGLRMSRLTARELGGLAGGVVLVCVLSWLAGMLGLTGRGGGVGLALLEDEDGVEQPKWSELAEEPIVRVRIMRRRALVEVGAVGGEGMVKVWARGGEIVIEGDARAGIDGALSEDGGEVRLGSVLGGPVRVNDRRYAGELVLRAVRISSGRAQGRGGVKNAGGRSGVGIAEAKNKVRMVRIAGKNGEGSGGGWGVDVVNYVGLEAYLPGVLEGELYRHWHPVAFAAQAVAARSYAIYESRRREGRSFDLESTTSSQMYLGLSGHGKAVRAVEATRGLVLTYEDLLVPAYYSSCSGGTGQDAAAIFPTAPDIAPLRGRDQGYWGAGSTRFRWELTRSRSELTTRIAAWGRSRGGRVGRTLGKLARLDAIEIVGRNAVGRPTHFALTGKMTDTLTGKTDSKTTNKMVGKTVGKTSSKTAQDEQGVWNLDAEEFRYACNYSGGGLPKLSSKLRLSSAHVSPRVEGDRVVFADGRGFGHGVGMCQWGMQAMADRGHEALAILAFYYPEAVVRRAYE